ncbi:MAG: metallopeptidase family protein [Alphaproteobacteria bacterium]
MTGPRAMTGPGGGRAPSAAELSVLADQALATIPAALRVRVQGVAILVEEFPDDATLEAMGLDSPFDLLGLYQGVPIGDKGVTAVAVDLDRIFLYRVPILSYWIEVDETLEDVVRNTLIHEIGHHFGLSDQDMDDIEDSED